MNKKIPITLVSLLMLLVPPCLFGSTFPDKPPSEHYYVDEAGLINPEIGKQIDKTAAALLDEEKIPLCTTNVEFLEILSRNFMLRALLVC
jgi:hypothetical protein